jgi:hypothetical protein
MGTNQLGRTPAEGQVSPSAIPPVHPGEVLAEDYLKPLGVS